jgi:hypothetical protein
MEKVFLRDKNGYENDSLAGEPLKNGDKVYLQWEDGSDSKHFIIIKKTESANEAYIMVYYKNMEALVRLAGQNILCKKIQDAPIEPYSMIRRDGKEVFSK